jgi:zinc protease
MPLARLLVTCSLAAVVAAPVSARPLAAQTAALPAASEITARHVKLIGGREALLKLSSIEMRGTMEMPAMGLKAELTAVSAKPNRSANRMSIPGIGEIVTGFDGETAWEVSPMQGPRLLTGKELEATRDDADMTAMSYPASAYKTLETVEIADFDGQKAYKVRAVRASGRESFDFFGVDSGLLLGRSEQRETAMGPVAMTTVMGDYKEFGGVKFPTRVTQKVDQQQMVITIANVSLGAVPDSAFAMPEAVKALKK